MHGPLLAILLADLLRRSVPQRPLKHFAYRALSPTFHDAPFFLCADPVGADDATAWAKSIEGRLAMRVEASFG